MDGRNVVSLHPCRVRMLKLREDYDFSAEDPQIFHEDEGDAHFKPHRAWPGITLPKVPPPKAIKALPKGPSGKPAVLSVLSDTDKEEFKRIHMEALQFHVKMLDSIGIDGVQELLDQRGIQTLQCIRKDSDHCRICSRVFKSVQRLREHIIKEHCPPSYQHFCDYEGCEFVGGSKGELNEHAKIHAKPAKKASELHCGPCNKSFPSLSKKNEHDISRHPKPGQEWVRTCEWCFEEEGGCKTTFKYINNLKAHQAKCKFQPGGAPRYGCTLCSADFAAVVYRNDHCRTQHPGQHFDPKEKNIVRRVGPKDPEDE